MWSLELTPEIIIKKLKKLESIHDKPVSHVEFSSKGNFFLSSSHDRSVLVHDSISFTINYKLVYS